MKHVPHWMPEWIHPGPLFRSSKLDPAICKALDEMEYDSALDYLRHYPVDESLLPPAGTRTLRVSRFPFVRQEKTDVL
jgi:hypothetical protein